MSFSYANWGNMNYGDGTYQCFRYGTSDDMEAVMSPGYFDPAFFGIHSIIMIEASDGKAVVKITATSPKTVVPWQLAGSQNGFSVVSSVSGTPITFSSTFRSAPALTITPRDGESGDYFRITAADQYGFTVTFYDKTDTAVSRTFDWSASNGGFAV